MGLSGEVPVPNGAVRGASHREPQNGALMAERPTAAPLSLRRAAPADAARIAEILILARSTFMPYAPSAHTDTEVRAWVQHHLLPGGGVTVAELDGELVGLMALSSQPDGS